MNAMTVYSEEVRDFYERRPYPPPLTSLDKHRELYANPQRRRALFHLIWPTEPLRADLRILVAGCGTSQAAKFAIREQGAQITAIDISETSLNHTRSLQRKHELNNLVLHQLSILEVGKLKEKFDLIVCTGVLHHLTDPDLGLQALRDVLHPDGAMQIMVYARYGRAGIYMMQEYCRLLGITPSNQELVALAQSLNSLPDDHPLVPLFRKGLDFQHPDALADTFLHPQDRSYSVRDVFEWLERCGMSFGRWYEQAPYLPECGAVAATPHALRLSALPQREQFSACELFRGTITRHHFIAYHNGRRTERDPIRFNDEGWRRYVPISVPWAVCVRDHLPPGTAAVLVNRAHHHVDLALRLDEGQYRVFSSINGTRTLGEIAETWRKEGVDGIELFRKLWQYDQIVFDASSAKG